MEQFFILGRNPELSRAEIISYLIARQIEYREILFKENFLIIDCPEINLQELGGTIKSGKLTFMGNLSEFRNFVDKEEIIPEDKFTYSLLGNFPDLEETLIDKFKQEKKKAIIRRGHKHLKIQEGEYIAMPKSDFQLFCLFHQNIYFGMVENEYSSSEIKQRDMKKPVRREELAISPRLSKILVNLSQAKPGDLLLDPFCGVGGIMQEALILGIKAVGIDKDRQAILGAEKNLRWLEKNYKLPEYKLENKDSRQTEDRQFDAIACEPSLGELVRKKPADREAEQIIKSFENQIIPILQRLKKVKKPEAKLAITLPFVRKFSPNIKKICEMTGLKVYSKINFPIREFRPEQFIGREIYVLQ